MIYYVRHGQTDYNLRGICAGQQDIPLNQTGIEQARAVAEQLKDVRFVACYCSPMLRARQTCAEILRYHPDVTPVYDDRVKERFCGKLENRSKDEIKSNKWTFEQYQDGNELGVESIPSILRRLTSFYDELRGVRGDVLVVAHGGIGKISHAYFYGMPEHGDFSQIAVPNASVITFDYQ